MSKNSFFHKVVNAVDAVRKTFTLTDPYASTVLTDLSNSVNINEDNALRLGTVQAAVSLISDYVAGSSLQIFERLPDGGKKTAYDHPLYYPLHDAPNPEMSSFSWRNAVTNNLLLRGMGYSVIGFDPKTGYPDNIYPVESQYIDIRRNRATNEIEYVFIPTGEIIPTWAIIAVPGLTANGVNALSVIEWNKQSLKLSASTEQFGLNFFENGTSVGGILSIPDKPKSSDEQKELERELKSKYQGLKNTHGLWTLYGGMTYEHINIPNGDSQWLESRRFNREEICAMFRCPVDLLYPTESGSYNRSEWQSVQFVTNTIRPWCNKIEQELNRKLLSTLDRRKYFIEFNLDAYLRGDIATRYNAYKVSLDTGFFTRNEIRKMENQNPVEGGDELLVPLNYTPLSAMVALKNNPVASAIVENEKKNTGSDNVLSNRSFLMNNYTDKLLVAMQSSNRDLVIGTFQTFAKDLSNLVKQELHSDKVIDTEIETFLKSYTESFMVRVSKGSLNLQDELNRLKNAIVKISYSALGITKIKSVKRDELEPCKLHAGKIISINDFFSLTPKVSHPPYTANCTCEIVAEF